MQGNRSAIGKLIQPAVAGAMVIFGTIVAASAHAGCLDFKPVKKVSWQRPDDFGGSMKFLKVSDTDDWSQGDWEPSVHRAPIVGLWEFKYFSQGNSETLKIPDGATIDGGITTWYADGNENTVSGLRDPGTGDVCLGTWQRTGEQTYELNHIGLSWDNVKHVYVGPGFIKQYVTLSSDGKSYTGTFTIAQLKPDGQTLALPAVIKGKIIAKRVAVDTYTFEGLP